MTPLDTYMLLNELSKEQPSIGCGLPGEMSTVAAVTQKEWVLVADSRTAEYGWGQTWNEYSLDVLLHFWYCEMGADCDPWDYQTPWNWEL